MKKRHTARTVLIGFIIALLFMVAAAIPLWPTLPARIKTWVAPQPPEMLFRNVFGRSVPASIRDLQVAGSETEQVIWMKFRIGQLPASSFASPITRIPEREFQSFAPRDYFHVSRSALDPSDRKAMDMGWTDVYQCKKPSYYSFYNPKSTPWFGIIAIDSATGMAYIRATTLAQSM